MFFPSMDFVLDQRDYDPYNNDLAEVQASMWNLFDPFSGLKLPYYSVNVHREMSTDEDQLIKTHIDRPVDHCNNLMDEGFEMISSSNIDEAHETKKKNMSKRKRVVDIKSDIIKGQWTPEEDGLLVDLVEKHGVGKWSSIAQMLPGRIGKQCRDRWHNHLKPNIKKDQWSGKEDQILIEAHMQLGNKWSEIARVLPGRSENTIKNHWNATKRRQLSSLRKSGRNSKSNDTPLQKYIRSLIIDTPLENPSSAGHSFDNNQVMWWEGNKMDDGFVDEESWKMLVGCNGFMEAQNDLQNQMEFMKTFLQ